MLLVFPTSSSWWILIGGTGSFASRGINRAALLCAHLFFVISKKITQGERILSLFLLFYCLPLSWSPRMPSIWWSCSAPSSPAQHSLSGTAIHKASSSTHRICLLRTTARRWCPTGTVTQPSPCVWPSPPRKRKPCRPLWPSAAHIRASPFLARTWPVTFARSSETRSTQGRSAQWPHRAAPQERSAGWQLCAPSAPLVHLRVQKPGFRQPRVHEWTGSKPSEPWLAIWEANPRYQRARETNWRRAGGSQTVRRAGEATVQEKELEVAQKQP